MRRFMITFNHIDGEWPKLSPEQVEQHSIWLKQFMEALKREKQSELVFLQPYPAAKTVRMHSDGKMDVSDGPYHSSDEQVGGYHIIEAESMEEAVEWARKGRFVRGSNEVREIADFQP